MKQGDEGWGSRDGGGLVPGEGAGRFGSLGYRRRRGGKVGRGWEWEVPGPEGAAQARGTHWSSWSSRSPYWSRKYSARSSSSMMPRLMVAAV